MPLVLMAIERPGWCFNNIATAVGTALAEHYEFRTQLISRSSKDPCDVLVCLCWERALLAKANIRCRAMVTCVYDHLSWCINEESLAHFKLTLRHSAALGVCNQRMAAEVRARVPADELPPLFMLEDGVDTAAFRLVPPPDKFACGWTGTSTRATPGGPEDYKGLKLLREACSRAGVVLRVLDAASGGQWPHSRMPVFYQDVSVQLVGSAYEGTPNPLLEALAMGRPVVTTPVGLVPELIKDGETGYIVERAAGPDGFAEKIRLLANLRHDALAAMGRRCRHAVEAYSWARKTAEWKRCLDLAMLGHDVARASMRRPVEVAANLELQLPPTSVAAPPPPAAVVGLAVPATVAAPPAAPLRSGLVELAPPVPPVPPTRSPRKLKSGEKPRALLISDVRDWAFHQNMKDLEEYLSDRFDFSHWFVADMYETGQVPDFALFDTVFAVYHRWAIDELLPRQTVGSLRSEYMFPEDMLPPAEREREILSRYRAFHVVTERNLHELRPLSNNVVLLTNPVNMIRFSKVAVHANDELIACWSGNANHHAGPHYDAKGFNTVVKPGCQLADVRLQYAEYHTCRLPRDAMPAFYLNANVAVCAARYGGASNSVMEAMASGLAIIATSVGNVPDMVKSELEHFGESGILTIERLPAALAAALHELKRDPDRVRRMGAINREEISKYWSWSVWRDRYAAFLRKGYEPC